MNTTIRPAADRRQPDVKAGNTVTTESITPERLRAVMGGFATGVAIITTKSGTELHGMTVNSLTSVSLAPPMLLVCFTRASRTALAVQARGAFVVNILDSKQQALSDRFARPGESHFEGVSLEYTDDGLPLLPSIGNVVCEVADIHGGGDHVIVLSRVVDIQMRPGQPLVYFRGKYDTITGNGRDAETLWYW